MADVSKTPCMLMVDINDAQQRETIFKILQDIKAGKTCRGALTVENSLTIYDLVVTPEIIMAVAPDGFAKLEEIASDFYRKAILQLVWDRASTIYYLGDFAKTKATDSEWLDKFNGTDVILWRVLLDSYGLEMGQLDSKDWRPPCER